jgi:hypothetical protein
MKYNSGERDAGEGADEEKERKSEEEGTRET